MIASRGIYTSRMAEKIAFSLLIYTERCLRLDFELVAFLVSLDWHRDPYCTRVTPVALAFECDTFTSP